jgi:hypothetical protein
MADPFLDYGDIEDGFARAYGPFGFSALKQRIFDDMILPLMGSRSPDVVNDLDQRIMRVQAAISRDLDACRSGLLGPPWAGEVFTVLDPGDGSSSSSLRRCLFSLTFTLAQTLASTP